MEDFGLKISKKGKDASGKNLQNLDFNSENSTYAIAKKITVTVNSNPYVVVHGLGYIPKVFVYNVLSDHNRKLYYDNGTTKFDFSVTPNEIKIRGTTSGTFVIYIFAQNIFNN